MAGVFGWCIDCAKAAGGFDRCTDTPMAAGAAGVSVRVLIVQWRQGRWGVLVRLPRFRVP